MVEAAILTGDVVDSGKLPASQRSTLLAQWLREALYALPFELSQGDTFQIQAPVADALGVALRIRAHLRAVAPLNGYRPDARISIGLGAVTFAGRGLNKSAGPAFERSGRGLPSLKQRQPQVLLTSANPALDAGTNTSLALLEILLQRWTPTQAATVAAALNGLNQQQIAELRGISQPAIQQQLKAAGWPGITALLAYYGTLVASSTPST